MGFSKQEYWSGLPFPSPGTRDSQESSPTPQFKSFNSSALSFLHSPTLTSIHLLDFSPQAVHSLLPTRTKGGRKMFLLRCPCLNPQNLCPGLTPHGRSASLGLSFRNPAGPHGPGHARLFGPPVAAPCIQAPKGPRRPEHTQLQQSSVFDPTTFSLPLTSSLPSLSFLSTSDSLVSHSTDLFHHAHSPRAKEASPQLGPGASKMVTWKAASF